MEEDIEDGAQQESITESSRRALLQSIGNYPTELV